MVECTTKYHDSVDSWEKSYAVAREALKPGTVVTVVKWDILVAVDALTIGEFLKVSPGMKYLFGSLALPKDLEEARKVDVDKSYDVAFRNALPALYVVQTTEELVTIDKLARGSCVLQKFISSRILSVEHLTDSAFFREALARNLKDLPAGDEEAKKIEGIQAANRSIDIYKNLGYEVPVVFCVIPPR